MYSRAPITTRISATIIHRSLYADLVQYHIGISIIHPYESMEAHVFRTPVHLNSTWRLSRGEMVIHESNCDSCVE